MSCKACGSNRLELYNLETLIHIAGAKSIDKPGVLVFPQATVCLECGAAEFTVPKAELQTLAEAGKATAA